MNRRGINGDKRELYALLEERGPGRSRLGAQLHRGTFAMPSRSSRWRQGGGDAVVMLVDCLTASSCCSLSRSRKCHDALRC